MLSESHNKQAFQRLLELGANPNVHINELENLVYTTASSPKDSEWLEIILEYRGDPTLLASMATRRFLERR